MQKINVSDFRCARRTIWLPIVVSVLVAVAPVGLSSTGFAKATQWVVVPGKGSAGSGPSLMQAADLDSDPRIAGLTFRCNEGRIDTLVVLVEPIPPRTHVDVTLTVGAQSQTFGATIIQTGAGLVVPFDPSVSLATAWSGQTQLHVAVDANGTRFSALQDLTGLAPALNTLALACVTSR